MQIRNKKLVVLGLTGLAAGVAGFICGKLKKKQEERLASCPDCECEGCCDCSRIKFCPDEMTRGCECEKNGFCDVYGDIDQDELPGSETLEESKASGDDKA